MTNLQFNMKGDPSDSERALRCWSTIRGNNCITHRREELMKQPWRENRFNIFGDVITPKGPNGNIA